MTKREYYVCDNCGKRMDYTDSDSDRYIAGLTITGVLKFRTHTPTSYGSSGWSVSCLDIEHICSPRCLITVFNRRVEEFTKAWKSRDVDVIDGTRVKIQQGIQEELNVEDKIKKGMTVRIDNEARTDLVVEVTNVSNCNTFEFVVVNGGWDGTYSFNNDTVLCHHTGETWPCLGVTIVSEPPEEINPLDPDFETAF